MECMSNMSQSLGLKKRSNRRPQGGVAATTKNMEAKRPALPKERGPRNTRKDAKGDERYGLGGPCHIARPAIGRGRDALLRDPAWHIQKTCNAGKTEDEDDWGRKGEKRGAI